MPESAEEKATRLERELEAERGRSGRGDAPTEQGRSDARKLLNRHRGRAEEALAAVVDENKELRVERRDLRAKLADFQKPGSVVLSAEDAKEYEAFKGLGKKAADVKKDLEGIPELRAKLDTHDRRTAADEAAPLAGYNPAALRELITDKKLTLSFRDEQKDGKTVRVPLVKPDSDDKAQPVPLVDYAKQHLAAYLPALTANVQSTNSKGTASVQPAKGVQMVEQSSGSSTAQTGDKPRVPSRSGKYMTPGQLATPAQQGTTS